MNVLLNRLDVQRIFSIQNFQNQEVIYLPGSVDPLAQAQAHVSISNLGHFFVQHITLSFTTLENIGAGIVDTGIDYLRGKLIDGKNGKPLFNDYIPFHLFGVPGRRKSLAALGSDSFQMQVIFPWEYMFEVNSDIIMDVKNDATLSANSYSMAFWGIRVKSSVSTSGL